MTAGEATRITQAQGLSAFPSNCFEAGNPVDGSGKNEEPERPILTASLTTGVARVTHGMQASVRLIDGTRSMTWSGALSVPMGRCG